MLSLCEILVTPSRSQSRLSRVASRDPSTRASWNAALYSGMKSESNQSQTSSSLHSSRDRDRKSELIRTVDAAAPDRTAELGCREIRVFPKRWKPEPLTVERESLSLPASESEKPGGGASKGGRDAGGVPSEAGGVVEGGGQAAGRGVAAEGGGGGTPSYTSLWFRSCTW